MPELGPLAGEPTERPNVRDGSVRDGGVRDGGVRDGSVRDGSVRESAAARFGAGLVWWILLMALWVMLDDSLDTDELLAGAGAAAIAALAAELATYQAATRFRLRISWLGRGARAAG